MERTSPENQIPSETLEELSKKLSLLSTTTDPLELLSLLPHQPTQTTNLEEDTILSNGLPSAFDEEELEDTDLLAFFRDDSSHSIDCAISIEGVTGDKEVSIDPIDYQHIFDSDYLREFETDDPTLDNKSEENILVDAFGHLGLEDSTSPFFHEQVGLNAYPTTEAFICQPCNLNFEITFDNFESTITDLGTLELDREKAEEFETDLAATYREQESNNLLQEMTSNQQLDSSHEMYDHPIPSFKAIRPEASVAAEPLMNNLNERQCFGHKGTIFGVAISNCGEFCATASQDSTTRIWDIAKNRLLSTIQCGDDSECLRVTWASSEWAQKGTKGFRRYTDDLLLATSGSDGFAKIWQSIDRGISWMLCSSIYHGPERNGLRRENDICIISEDNSVPGSVTNEDNSLGSEIYCLQFIDTWKGLPLNSRFDSTPKSLNVLMTSAEDFIYIWEYDTSINNIQSDFRMNKVLSLHFTHLACGYGGVFVHVNIDGTNDLSSKWTKENKANLITTTTTSKAFGGDRNPNNLVFVFDAVQCPANDLLGVALSDGSLRLINGRGVCMTILQLPGCQSHLTSFAWNKSGTRLASCVASGQVVLWDINHIDGRKHIEPSCRSVLEGGHKVGRPLYGASFFGGDEDLLLTWGVDGRLVLWDSYSSGQIHSPIRTLVDNEDYPIYAVDHFSCPNDTKRSFIVSCGGREAGFIGVPFTLYDLRVPPKP
jgi:WD40 repeat protein